MLEKERAKLQGKRGDKIFSTSTEDLHVEDLENKSFVEREEGGILLYYYILLGKRREKGGWSRIYFLLVAFRRVARRLLIAKPALSIVSILVY